MSSLPIKTGNAEGLRIPTYPVVPSSPKEKQRIKGLVAQMISTMKLANAAGLAANQVGIPESVVVTAHPSVAWLNPVIIRTGSKKAVEVEGCLSLPDIQVEVPRWVTVEVEYRDLDFRVQREVLNGTLSRVLQHEIDHLQGKLITDYGEAIKHDQADIA